MISSADVPSPAACSRSSSTSTVILMAMRVPPVLSGRQPVPPGDWPFRAYVQSLARPLAGWSESAGPGLACPRSARPAGGGSGLAGSASGRPPAG
jgi:hypothetical protein